MPLRVELVYLEGCPHAETARRNLRAALRRAGLPQVWVSWNLDAWVPDGLRGYPSPTVLVDGDDVTNASRGVGVGCAVHGAPGVDGILNALERALGG
jgi:hypothetical protein